MKLELSSIRAQNLRNIFMIIHQQGSTTRSILAKETGLSLMTVSNVVDVMLNDGLVAVTSKKSSAGAGRKAELVSVNPKSHIMLILDLTSYAFDHVVLGVNGRVVLDAKPIPTHSEMNFEAALKAYLSEVRQELADAKLLDRLMGVGLSVPGPYQQDTDTVFNKLIPELNTMPLLSTVQIFFPSVLVYDVNEDVKYAAQANLAAMENASEITAAYIYLGAGLGGALMSQGRVMMGASAMAGELSPLVIGPDMRRAGSLNRSDFLRALDIDPNGDWVTQLVRAKAQNPDKVMALVDQVLADMTELCFALTWLWDPHRIIIECDHIRLLDESFDDRLQKLLASRLQGVAPAHPCVTMTRHGLRYAYRGAAMSLVMRYLDFLAVDHSYASSEGDN